MGELWDRFALMFKTKANKSLEKHEDIGETLDYSYQRQLDMLSKVRNGMADVSTSRKQVENQMNEIDIQIRDLTRQAEKAIELDREDLAREALSRKSILTQQKADLKIQHDSLAEQEEKLKESSAKLQAKVETFRVKKETIKATHSAASAQVAINESFAGLGGEFADVGLALSRAEDQTATMVARNEAIGELLASGALNDGSYDDIAAELNAADATKTVEYELESMKAAAKALPAGKSE